MMNCKLAMLAISMLLLIGTASAIELSFKGTVAVSLEKNEVETGEELNAVIRVANKEEFPLLDAHIVVEVVSGEHYYSPSYISNAANVFHEQIIRNINLAAGESKEMRFSYTLPSSLRHGVYRLDVYFGNRKALIEGIAHLFESPASAHFLVLPKKGAAGEFPPLKIVRSKTTFNGTLGQIGAPTQPDNAVDANVIIYNPSDSRVSNAELLVSVCSWDDTACDSFLQEKKISIEPIEAGEEKQIKFQINAPSLPDAYAVRLELKNSNGELLSLYRNRLIVAGATKKIRKLYINNYHFNPDETVKINALIGPSPDHYNNSPVLQGAKLNLSIKDLKTNKTVFEKTIELEPAAEFYLEKEIQFQTEAELALFQVCAAITKSTVTYDSYCFNVDSLKLLPKNDNQIEISWKYDEKLEKLALELCAYSSQKIQQPIHATYFLSNGAGQLIAEGTAESNECTTQTIENIKKEKHSLLLQNLLSEKQQKIEIDIKSYLSICENRQCEDNNPCTKDGCSGGVCTNIALPNGTGCGEGKSCFAGRCMLRREEEGLEGLISIAAPIGVIMGIILILFGLYRYYKKKKQMSD